MNEQISSDNRHIYQQKFIATIPKYTKIAFVFFIISITVHVTSFLYTPFSDFFTENIASVLRTTISTITGWFPFSLAETFILMLPVLILVYIVLTNDYFIKKDNPIKPLFYAVLSVIMILYSVAVFTFLTGYSNSTLDKKINIEASNVTTEELYTTADIVYKNINILSDQIEYSSDGFSSMPYNLSDMSNKLIESYNEISVTYNFLHNVNAQIKPIAMSEAMSYTHITGIYTFFTGEANIDAAFPDFTLPYTAAHEFAHQRGIARENEANFIAFLVCINSSDSYIKYSGYMNMLEYLLSALYSADKDLYSEFYSTLSSKIKAELRAYSAFFDKYRDSTASKVSGAVNDTYLKLQGTQGSKSYGMVVDLAVAYYKNN